MSSHLKAKSVDMVEGRFSAYHMWRFLVIRRAAAEAAG
jgi:hypothetical protein